VVDSQRATSRHPNAIYSEAIVVDENRIARKRQDDLANSHGAPGTTAAGKVPALAT
jgi:hypothetical protein